MTAEGSTKAWVVFQVMSDEGFSIYEDILSPHECEVVVNALNDGDVCRSRAGARNLMSHPAAAKLAYDSRLLHLAKKILGDHAVPFRATLFDKSRSSNWHVLWHQDRALPLSNRVPSAEWGPWSTKSGVLYAIAPVWALERIVALRIHLDASTEDNGPLRVIAGTHEAGVLSGAEIDRLTSNVPAKACVVGRGGVVAMRPLLLHSSKKASNNQPRRVLHIEYAVGLNFGNNIQLSFA